MAWDLQEVMAYYKTQGAPGDQNALKELLREVQQQNGGSLTAAYVNRISLEYNVKSSLLIALIKRTPSLRLSDVHTLELCAGPNCGKHVELATAAERICSRCSEKVELRFVPCMRMCGKGPNLKWDGTLYHKADEALLLRLTGDLRQK